MADNTAQNATDIIATDDLTSYNGTTVALGTAKVQRVKVGYGVEDTFRDVSATYPLPILINDPGTVVTGTITTMDLVVAAPAGAGAPVSGASTTGSYLSALLPGNDSSWNMQITGMTSGTLYFEASLDSTNGVDGNWISVDGRQTGVINTVLSNNTTTNGVFRGNSSANKYIRIRSVGTMVGTPAIVIRSSGGTGAIFLNASIPAGTNAIGTVLPTPSATPTVSGVAASATSVTLLAANTARKGATVQNSSTSAILYLRLGVTAAAITSGNYTAMLNAGAYYEVPFSYNGAITGIWSAATGFANMTEVT